MLTEEEQKEWEEAFRQADAGDKVRKKEVKEIRMVKEMKSLKYNRAVWMPGDEPDADEEEEEKDEEEESPPKKPPRPLEIAHFIDTRTIRLLEIYQSWCDEP
jgi:hypothetical protein